ATLPNRSEEAMMTVTTHEEIRVGEMVIRFLLEGEESGGSVAAFEFDVPMGAKVAAAHSHDGYDETIYGLEGILTWTLEGVLVDVGPADALLIPRRPAHHLHTTHHPAPTPPPPPTPPP